MSERISQQQLESYLWGAATLLRGTIDAGDYKQFIFPLLFYKRLCDVFDEETQAALKESGGDKAFAAYPENHRFQIPFEAHWRNVRQAAKNVGNALQSAMRAIETANPDKLYGIFGDAQWTNKDRLSDSMLRDLVEHFSTLELAVAKLPEDELGQGYEYLIKKFADDAGHTAAEFYTNRTVVHLMTEMLKPQPSESIYDPTCGSGGMLLSCITQLRRQGQEWRNVRLYGQERNLMTSSIARMNCFLHGIEDFQIVRGDTLSEPKFVQRDRLMRFDVVLANPPYSIKQWDRAAFASDPWGRNLFGTPPQGRADYAFWQHILCSLAPKTGRCAILFPHGVLFRQEEAEMRTKLIETDTVECVLGLGPNLFYNAAMEACVVICRTSKPKARKGRILFINAVNEVTRERAQSFLTEDHIKHIADAYDSFKDQPGFASIAGLEEVRKNSHSLKIDLYVATPCASNGNGAASKQKAEFEATVAVWNRSRIEVRDALAYVLPDLTRGDHGADPRRLAVADVRRQFDQESWSRVRFGDVVKFVKDSVDPSSGELDRYVAGEHMDTDEVHIRRWGTVGDGYLGPAFIRRFRKGQVLYGSRRTYLKKVAYAEFDGITANTTFVLQGVEGKLHQPLLPWLMLSHRFTQHSVRESKGSTNPYINFPDIATFEFGLPPLDQQRRIADILWAVDGVIERYSDFEAAAREAASCLRHEHYTNGTRHALTPLRQAGRWLSGGTPSRSRAEFWDGLFPWVSPKDMKQPLITDSEEHLSEAGRKESTEVGSGALLVVIRGMILAHSFPVAIAQRNVAFNQDMKALVPSEAFSSKYLFHWFQWATPKVLGRISDSSHGTKRLAMEDLFEMKVPTPTLEDQSILVEQIEKLELAEVSAHKNIEALKLFWKAFLDRLVT
jgi:type I restriction enzyme M protein